MITRYERGLFVMRMAIKEGLEEITKLESRIYPRPAETEHLRACFYAIQHLIEEKVE